MEIDPTACYLEMYWAMRDGRPAEARRLAELLKKMLDSGIAPLLYSEVEVRAYTASVLRRTAGIRECAGPSG